MYCQNCNYHLDDNAYICPNCGCLVQKQEEQTQVKEGSSVGWGFLSFFFPVVGLILFICWKETRPKTYKVCGIWALIGYIVGFLIFCVFIGIAAYLGATNPYTPDVILSALLRR